MLNGTAASMLARIADAAKTRGLNRRALAQRAGVRPETVSRIASRGTCDFATLERIQQKQKAGFQNGHQTSNCR